MRDIGSIDRSVPLRIGVTGGAGRFGGMVVEAARAAGHVALPVDMIGARGRARVDLRDHEATLRSLAGVDAIIHLAAHPNPLLLPGPLVYSENVTISFNVLNAANVLGVRKVVVASSVNAIGGSFSRAPRFLYVPLDVRHPRRTEDPYGLSKWAAEEQAEHFYGISSPETSMLCVRLHALQERSERARLYKDDPDLGAKDLWGYTPPIPAARAMVRAVERRLPGFHRFYLVAGTIALASRTECLLSEYLPSVSLRSRLEGNAGLYDIEFANRELGWAE